MQAGWITAWPPLRKDTLSTLSVNASLAGVAAAAYGLDAGCDPTVTASLLKQF